jgi:hypothetical protein
MQYYAAGKIRSTKRESSAWFRVTCILLVEDHE